MITFTTYDGKVYLSHTNAPLEEIQASLEMNKFIRIGEALVSTKTIAAVEYKKELPPLKKLR